MSDTCGHSQNGTKRHMTTVTSDGHVKFCSPTEAQIVFTAAPKHQLGRKSLACEWNQPLTFTLWSSSSENTLLEIVSPFQMNPPTHPFFFFKCSWTEPENEPFTSSPAFICDHRSSTLEFWNYLSLAFCANRIPKLRQWFLNWRVAKLIFVDPT